MLDALAPSFASLGCRSAPRAHTEVVIAPPALYLLQVQAHLASPVQVAAQNCFTESSGAFTGEIAPAQLVDARVPWVILGHSERRSMFGDTDKFVADKTRAATEAGLSVVLCVGETLEQREKDETWQVVQRQLEAVNAVIKKEDWKWVPGALARGPRVTASG